MLDVYRFRMAQDCQFDKTLYSYVSNEFGIEQANNASTLFTGLNSLRETISALSPSEKDVDLLEKNIKNIQIYINSLNKVGNFIKFDKNNCNLNFKWKEFTTLKNVTNNNFYFEICSAYYNMAITYILIGKIKASNLSVDTLKEALKYFQYGAETIQLVINYSNRKVLLNKGNDLTENNLLCCYNYCLAMAQEALYKFSCIKNLNVDLRKKIAKGIAYFYGKILNLSSSLELDKFPYKYYYTFYNCIAIKYEIEQLNVDFTRYAKNGGLIIGYAISLKNSIENIEKQSKSKNLDEDFYKLKSWALEFYNNFNDKNNRIYHEKPVLEDKLPQIPHEITKVKPIKFPEITEELSSINLINQLLPYEYQQKYEEYLNKLESCITMTVNNFLNDTEANKFLSQRNLPGILSSGISSKKLSNEVYNSIQNIQNKGGIDAIDNKLNKVDKVFNDIKTNLDSIQSQIANAYEDDQKLKLRACVGVTYNPLDYSNIHRSNQALYNQLNQIYNDYMQCKSRIDQKRQYYILFGLSKNEIELRLPSSVDTNSLSKIPSIPILHTLISKITMDNTNYSVALQKIVNQTKNNVPIKEIMNYSITTDMCVGRAKTELDEKLTEIINLKDVVLKDMKDIETNYQKFIEDCNKLNSNSSSSEADVFLNFFSNAENEYFSDISFLDNILSQCSECESHTMNLYSRTIDIMESRNQMKDEFIKKEEQQFNRNMAFSESSQGYTDVLHSGNNNDFSLINNNSNQNNQYYGGQYPNFDNNYGGY